MLAFGMISIIVMLIFGIVFVVLAITLVNKFTRTFNHAKNTIEPYMDMIKEADRRQMSTPKSLDGTEPVYVPKISKDFPEMNIALAKTFVSNFLPQYFSALSSGDYKIIEDDCSSQMVDRIKAVAISAAKTTYSDVVVHKVVVSNYKKTNTEATIEFQAAVQYMTSNSSRINQTKYKVLYSYYLDMGDEGENVSLTCKHCGAPISVVGAKKCPYCEAAIESSIVRTWKITDVKIVRS